MSCGKACNCGSYREHLLSIGIGAAATPSRRSDTAERTARERALDKDLDAYQRLRRDGVQPVTYQHCAAVEKVATTREQIEGPSAA